MAKKHDAVNWSLVWRDLTRWYNHQHTTTGGWRAQQNKIRELVEAQLEKRRG